MTYRAWDLKTLDRAAVRELTHAIAEQRTEELEYSAMDEEPWSEQKYAATLAAQQKETALLAGILAARGITDPADALTLLAGEEELSDPALLTDMEKACQRIWQAIDNGETIVVFGDYDVDGVTATALLYQHLKGMGAAVKCMLPSREGDGYGLSRNAIQSIHDKGYRLIVTVDNGISAVAEADFAAELGIDLIITDHHLPPETLPKAVAVVDPRREDDTSPFKGLCGAGVAFKRKYIQKGWLAAWLDEKTEKLYLTVEDYRAAQETAAAPQAQPQPEPAPEQREETPLNLETARRFAAVLEQEKQLMQDELARDELDHMQKTANAICDWLEAHPESLPKARRFAEYYIPTTLKLLHTYNDVQGQQGANAESIRRDIAGILHTLNQAFDNLYDNLLSDVAMDVSSEIAALQGMLANDGLTGRDFQ